MSVAGGDAVRQLSQAIVDLRVRAEAEGADAVVDDLRKMERAVGNLHDQFASLPEQLAQASDAEAQRKLRHDLRTPINQIIGYCELLAEEAEEDGDDRFLDALQAILVDTRALQERIARIGTDRSAELSVAAPVAAASSHDGWQQLATASVSDETGEVPGTILVVDDNPENRELLERRLLRDGFAVRTAEHGAQALEIIEEQSIDVVLLDIMMPVMDGYATLHRLKSDPEHVHLPVIMLTSLDEPESITRCIENGAEDHLPKPFDPLLLRARIGASLSKKRMHDLERAYLERILAEKRRADELLHGVIPIGVALSAERDLNRLLERVLREARRFCGADGGVLYLRRDDRLDRVQLQCASIGMAEMGEGEPGDRPSLRLEVLHQGRRRPAAKAAVGGVTVNVPDLREAEDLDLQAVEAFDERHGYRTRSLIALPLREVEGEVVGVLELWNATRATDGEIVPFDRGMIDVLESLSSLAGVALESYRRETELRQRIRHLEIRVDEANRRREVSQITETDYFRKLRDLAQKIRATTEP